MAVRMHRSFVNTFSFNLETLHSLLLTDLWTHGLTIEIVTTQASYLSTLTRYCFAAGGTQTPVAPYTVL